LTNCISVFKYVSLSMLAMPLYCYVQDSVSWHPS